jgi:hypothetical protein
MLGITINAVKTTLKMKQILCALVKRQIPEYKASAFLMARDSITIHTITNTAARITKNLKPMQLAIALLQNQVENVSAIIPQKLPIHTITIFVKRIIPRLKKIYLAGLNINAAIGKTKNVLIMP